MFSIATADISLQGPPIDTQKTLSPDSINSFPYPSAICSSYSNIPFLKKCSLGLMPDAKLHQMGIIGLTPIPGRSCFTVL